jgi:hypothetical protein
MTTQTVTTISITGVAPSVLQDIHTYWLDQAGPAIGATPADIDATSDTLTVEVSQASLSAAQAMPSVGQTVAIQREPMTVTAVAGNVLTLTRGASPQSPKAVHPAGSPIAVLTFQSTWDMLTVQAIRPWVQHVAVSLGQRSATFGASATGTIGLVQ